MAFFGSQGGSPIFTLGIPLAVSIGAVAMNFMTTDILGERGAPEWIKGFWFICIVFDGYTVSDVRSTLDLRLTPGRRSTQRS